MHNQNERDRGEIRVEGLKFNGVRTDLSSAENPIIIDTFLKGDKSKTMYVALSEKEAQSMEIALRSARILLARRKKELKNLKFLQKPNFIPE